MKKKIAILGSTGSIGKTTFNIIKKNKKEFDIVLLTTNKNINEIYKQARLLNVKKILISSKHHYLKAKKNSKFKKIKIYNNLNDLNKIIKKKIYYTMSAITGLTGLKPTLDCIKFSNKIAIANKESIVCAWNLIEKQLKKYNTEFIPVDSEHFSIWSLINNTKKTNIEKIIITASGGPFLNLPKSKFKNINPKKATKHPMWSMGRKISIDSSTMMNKVFEVIEAQRIFKIKLNKFKILIHPKSYLHAIVKFENGLTKMLIHDTDMSIPIFNSIYSNKFKKLKSKNLNISYLNNLDLSEPDINKFPFIKILKIIPQDISLFETVLITANDELVNYFLEGKIKYTNIFKYLNKIINSNEFKKYLKKKPNDIKQIANVVEQVRLKTREVCII